jgi:Protein of unknown function (DUF2569)
MARDPADLEAIYRRWPTEKLVRASTREADQYDAATLPIMQRVLDERGLSPEELSRSVAEADGPDLSRVTGWLAFFIFQVVMGATAELLFAFLELADSPARLAGSIVGMALSLYGFWCAALLIRRRPLAPTHARLWMLLNLSATLIAAALAFLANEHSVDEPTLTAALRSLFFAAIWLRYLSASKRVAAVYTASA